LRKIEGPDDIKLQQATTVELKFDFFPDIQIANDHKQTPHTNNLLLHALHDWACYSCCYGREHCTGGKVKVKWSVCEFEVAVIMLLLLQVVERVQKRLTTRRHRIVPVTGTLHFMMHNAHSCTRHFTATSTSITMDPISEINTKTFVRSILGQKVVCTLSDGQTASGRLICVDRL
jgi:hypothetical protein